MTFETEKALRDYLMYYPQGNKTINICGIISLISSGDEGKARDILTKRNIVGPTAEKIIEDVRKAIEDIGLKSQASNNKATDNSFSSLFGTCIIFADGIRGRSIEVYEDFAVITVAPTAGAILTGNATDGRKIIFYKDIIGIQYKSPGATIGYIQLETASPMMNNTSSNFFNENTFTYSVESDSTRAVLKYIFNRVREIKTGKKKKEEETGRDEGNN